MGTIRIFSFSHWFFIFIFFRKWQRWCKVLCLVNCSHENFFFRFFWWKDLTIPLNISFVRVMNKSLIISYLFVNFDAVGISFVHQYFLSCFSLSFFFLFVFVNLKVWTKLFRELSEISFFKFLNVPITYLNSFWNDFASIDLLLYAVTVTPYERSLTKFNKIRIKFAALL